MEPLDILAVAPHPDDAELGSAGLLLLAAQQGLRTGILDLSLGDLGSKGDAETREREAVRAAEILGLSVRENLGLPDGGILDTPENRAALVEGLRRHRPRLLLSVHPEDRHPDHRGAAALCQAAFFLCRLPRYETGSRSFSPAALWYYFIHDPMPTAVIVDISRVFQRKIEAIRAYQSQFVDAIVPDDYTYIGTSNYLQTTEAVSRLWGQRIGTEYGEGFQPAQPLRLGENIGALLDSLGGYPSNPGRKHE
jgi:bacillithiol biosynthesis deacetylase BshB1